MAKTGKMLKIIATTMSWNSYLCEAQMTIRSCGRSGLGQAENTGLELIDMDALLPNGSGLMDLHGATPDGALVNPTASRQPTWKEE